MCHYQATDAESTEMGRPIRGTTAADRRPYTSLPIALAA
jgi:hypothetical protein